MTRQEELVQTARKEYPEWEEAQCHFIDGAHYADSHPHWISVEDELPKENGWYLVCNNIHDYGHCLYEIAEYHARFRSWIWAHTVTHWMPLPQPPKGGEE